MDMIGVKEMKMFYLKRGEDESGVSGTGRVAQGFIFDNGKVAVTWLSEHPSVTVYDNIGEVTAIHGHGGKTEVVMEPDYKEAYGELRSFIDNFSLPETMKEKLPLDSQTVKLIKKGKVKRLVPPSTTVTTVAVSGGFDPIHKGHVRMIRAASALEMLHGHRQLRRNGL